MSLQTRLKPIQRFLSEGKRLPTYLGIFATVFALYLLSYAPPFARDFIDRLELVIYDQRLEIMPRPVRNQEHRIVIVDLDERSLQYVVYVLWVHTQHIATFATIDVNARKL